MTCRWYSTAVIQLCWETRKTVFPLQPSDSSANRWAKPHAAGNNWKNIWLGLTLRKTLTEKLWRFDVYSKMSCRFNIYWWRIQPFIHMTVTMFGTQITTWARYSPCHVITCLGQETARLAQSMVLPYNTSCVWFLSHLWELPVFRPCSLKQHSS